MASSNPHIVKVAELAKKPASALTSDDDPQGKAACVADSWRVPEKVIFYMRAGDGRVKRCSPYVFGVGDLVDVNSYVDVATYRDLEVPPLPKSTSHSTCSYCFVLHRQSKR